MFIILLSMLYIALEILQKKKANPGHSTSPSCSHSGPPNLCHKVQKSWTFSIPHNLFPSSFCIVIKHRHLSKYLIHLSHPNLFTHNLPWHCHLLSLPARLRPLHSHSPHLPKPLVTAQTQYRFLHRIFPKSPPC